MNLRPIFDDSLHLFHVILVDPLRVCKIFGDIYGNDNFIYGTVGVGRDDSTACKVHTFCREIQTEAALLAFQTGAEGAYRFVS